jgi:hypothetical protein
VLGSGECSRDLETNFREVKSAVATSRPIQKRISYMMNQIRHYYNTKYCLLLIRLSGVLMLAEARNQRRMRDDR